jgi:integrase
VVKMPEMLATVLAGAPSGRLVTFQGRPVKKINKAWRGMRRAAGLDEDVNPYSIRHTMARWVRQNGVPVWEVAAQLGHNPAITAPPSSMRRSIRRTCRTRFAPVDEPFFRAVRQQRIEIDWKFGAGEGIRTPDPNLGKVVLYP